MKFGQNKPLAAIAGLAIVTFVFFQNCTKVGVSDTQVISSQAVAPQGGTDPVASDQVASDPVDNPTLTRMPASTSTPIKYIQLTASPTTVVEGHSSTLTVTFQELTQVSYMCTDRATHEILATGMIDHSGQQLEVTVNRDLHCEVSGNSIGADSAPMRDSKDLVLDCANRIKNTAQNKCQDFSCQKVIQLTSMNDLMKIPARDSNGLCYSIKLLDHIAFSSSSLTTATDSDVISANHDGGPIHHPYSMGSVKTEFRLDGPRVVKLSGGNSATNPILVDNFVLMGVYPSSKDISQSLASVYHVMGTSDSSIPGADGSNSNSVDFKGTLLPIASFGSSGTSSVAAIDITTSAEPQVNQTLDLRALDCGGSRELSDVYLVFQ